MAETDNHTHAQLCTDRQASKPTDGNIKARRERRVSFVARGCMKRKIKPLIAFVSRVEHVNDKQTLAMMCFQGSLTVTQ